MNRDYGDIIELTSKLNGVILRKAEMENDFKKVYLEVFEKIFEMNACEEEDVLEIFGNASS